MDIHAPDKPILSLKEFGVHIAVVTVGILIALAFEGVREVIHDRHLVRETRENFRAELRYDLDHDRLESARVTELSKQLDQLVADLPALRKDHPDQIATRLVGLQNPFYFLTQNSWQATLSTGALAHMPTDDIQTYAGAFESIRTYTGLQQQCMTAEDRSRIFFAAHPNPTPAELEEGTERLLLFQRQEWYLVHVGQDLRAGLEEALKL